MRSLTKGQRYRVSMRTVPKRSHLEQQLPEDRRCLNIGVCVVLLEHYGIILLATQRQDVGYHAVDLNQSYRS